MYSKREVNKIRIKICGLKNEKDAEYLNELKSDYAGFVFAPGRKRTIDRAAAASLRKALDKEIQAVGVFVDEPMDNIVSLFERRIIDIAQLHGDEDGQYISRLKERISEIKAGRTGSGLSAKENDIRVIKAFVVKSADDIKRADESPADMVLLDSGQGSGQKLSLSLLNGIKRPYFLAGGLDPVNVSEAIASAPGTLYGVDVSSGVETDGNKDYFKIRDFIERIR